MCIFKNKINDPLHERLISLRREFHKYPEAGWTEFRTTARIIQELTAEGIPVRWGRELHDTSRMYGLPDEQTLEATFLRASEDTSLRDIIAPMRGGFTGCIAKIEGALPGKTTVFRVDIDACQLEECHEHGHRPAEAGFDSVYSGVMHACGHDAHAAIGIGAAIKLFHHRDKLHGTVYVLFQPAEEGLRGAASMCAAGLLDGCDTLIGLHVGLQSCPVGTVAASCNGFLSSAKFNIAFHGKAAHAALSPELGRNAVAAAAKATLALLDLPNNYDCLCRVNVGTFHGGSGRNVIPAEAVLEAETRSDDPKVSAELFAAAQSICTSAAEEYGCTVDIHNMGDANSARCNTDLAEHVAEILSNTPWVSEVIPEISTHGSEDFTTLMDYVQKHGGKATYLMLGMPLPAAHHSRLFDVFENVITGGADVLYNLGMTLGCE